MWLNFWELKLRLFSYKNLSQIPCKVFPAKCFFTDHLKQKTLNKTTCRMPSANSRQLFARKFKSFLTAMIIFWGFQGLPIYMAKYLWSLLNSPNDFRVEISFMSKWKTFWFQKTSFRYYGFSVAINVFLWDYR